MDDYEYIKKMDKIGLISIGAVVIITVIGLVVYNMGYETESYILMGIMIFFAIVILIYAANSNKKQFVLVLK